MTSLLLFDGDCAACNRTVRFLRRHGSRADLGFAPMRSPAGRAELGRVGLDPETVDTLVLIDEGRVLVRSSAVLRVCGMLDRPWRWLRVLGVLPRWLLDACYAFVARRRSVVFGSASSCEFDPTIRRDEHG